MDSQCISAVERRLEKIEKNWSKSEYHRYEDADHGFGLGSGTDAEGWLNLTIHFWEDQFQKKR